MCDLLTFSPRAIQAEISDGDYRTYMVLCALALDNLAEAGLFATELTYAEIGAHHPKAMTANGVRSRINRLMRAGLVGRERIDHKRWRTVPILDQALSGLVHNTQAKMAANGHITCQEAALSVTAPTVVNGEIDTNQAQPPLPAATPMTISKTAEPALTVVADSTQVEPLLPLTTPTDVNVPTDLAVTVATEHTQPDSPLPDAAPTPPTGAADSTQPAAAGPIYDYVHPDGSVVEGPFITLSYGGYEDDETLPVREKINRDLARKAEIRAAMAALNVPGQDAPKSGINGLGVASQNGRSLINDHDHDYINKISIHDHDQINSSHIQSTAAAGQPGLGNIEQEKHLALILANLPKPMNPDGMVECLQKPALCAAWISYATNPANNVRNPAAYIRKGVRSDAFPPSNQAYISPNSPVYSGKENLSHESSQVRYDAGVAQGELARQRAEAAARLALEQGRVAGG